MPPETTPEPPPAVVVLSREEVSEVVASVDLPRRLVKGGQVEQALVRQAVFVTGAVTVTRPAAEPEAAPTYGWSLQAFVQRQVCVHSITGLFACSDPEVEKLPDAAKGEAPLGPGEPPLFPLAEAAREALTAGLKARANAVFEADRRARIDPLFRAAGVTAQRPPAR
ncbi:hypothetical protein [Phenylobacterium sp. J367]|uniref:hypothetical protein n=1 Tax=Phenylobacterium sp. J367 TaxID=2898435 RepID=UPI002151F0BC|nr:hypothetical protein [Phenylobacterium sp. J367]MCR5880613.1 hypothetical protein [Phenylobacterium sp. J367]